MALGAAIRLAVGDGVLTLMWVFFASTIGAFTSIIAAAADVQGPATLFIVTCLIASFVFIFTFVGEFLGGASSNPTGIAAFYAAGFSEGSLFSMALRFPAQAAGAAGGALLIKEVMPKEYQHTLAGPSLKVDLHTGAIAELLLTFLITFAALVIIARISCGRLVRTWLISMATVAMIAVGSPYTGPSMNPANAFGWAYVNNKHNTWEQLYVYWICPFVGAIAAASVYKVLFPQPKKKQPRKSLKAE